MAQVTILNRAQALLNALVHHSSNNSSIYLRTISTTSILSQQPQYAEPPSEAAPDSSTPLPPNPASGSPLYSSNWRSPIPQGPSLAQSLVPLGILNQSKSVPDLPRDVPTLMNLFANWMTTQQWYDMKQLFELWVRSLDRNGKPNKPDVHIYNHYLRANLMTGASAGALLDLVTQMDDYDISPNTASFNLVLKGMLQAKEATAAEKLVERMLQMGKESKPDDESFDLLINMFLTVNQIETALKYIDVVLKSGSKISDKVFKTIVRILVNRGRSDTLVSIVEKCKASDQNKGLCPPWELCSQIAEVATDGDNSKLAFCALEYMARWIARGEIARPPVLLSVEEGVVVAALGTAARTYNSTLIDASWAVLKRSLRGKKLPNPESFLGKIYAYASLGNLQKAFSTLHELESAYGNSEQARDILSPFTSLNPLVVACSKKGFETLDAVYFQLENLSRANPPYKSVAALNCVITGCANIWDLDRAYQTFEAINQSFGLSPDVHSFNALVYAFGKQKKAPEASDVFQHMLSVGIKPDATSYSLLVDAHLANRDPKSALAVVDDMINAGFIPTKDLLKKLRRRCTREMNYECDDKVDSVASKFGIRMRAENRRDVLFNLEYSTEFVERLS